jgi:hypothetical protein
MSMLLGGSMKRRALTISIAIVLFTMLAIPGQIAAQDNQDHNHYKQVRYSIKVLGTLGGTFSEAVEINDSGSMAGISTTTGKDITKIVNTDGEPLPIYGGPSGDNSPGPGVGLRDGTGSV